MKQRVVVLGAGGFIGRQVLSALQASDWADPVGAVRRPGPAPERTEWVQADATDEAALQRVLQGAQGVVNCVAGTADSIVANARALFSAASQCSPRPRVVYLSSMAVYGASSGTLSESSALAATLGGYSVAKIAAERVAGGYDRAVVLRPGIVYGPRSPWWSGHIARLLLQRRLGDLGSNGRGICNLLYVDDMAAAALRSLRTPGIEGSTFNVAVSSPPTWNEYFALYASALGATPLLRIRPWRLAMELRVAGPLLVAAASAMRLAGLPAGLAPPIRPWLIELTRRKTTLDVGAAEKSLSMQWTPVEHALSVTANWYLGSSGS